MNMRQQRGVGLIGLLFWGVLGALLFVVGAQIVPSISEFREIKAAAEKAAREGGSVAEVRAAFDKQVVGGYIQSIKGADLDITKDGRGKIVVNFAYQKKLPLVGPASLVIDYAGSAVAQ